MEETREDTSGALEDIVHLGTARSPRVLIVGAGFAGVAAAGTLLAGGIHDVTILEALDRPGGRVQTILLGEKWIWRHSKCLDENSSTYDVIEYFGVKWS